MPEPQQWQVSGDAAEYYQQIPVRYMLGPWAPGLVAASGLQPDEQVLDIACGTGVVTRAAAAKLGPGGHVTGLDLNEGMLKVAEGLGNPGAGGIDWIRCSAQEIELPDAAFDLVLCQQGLQFFPDRPKALSETHRVLRDGGRACFSVWAGAGPYNNAVAAAIARHLDDATAQQYPAARDVPDAGTLRALFPGAGFKEAEVTRTELEIRLPDIDTFALAHLAGTPIAEAFGSLSAEEQAALAKDTAERLSSYADGADAVVPDCSNLVFARK